MPIIDIEKLFDKRSKEYRDAMTKYSSYSIIGSLHNVLHHGPCIIEERQTNSLFIAPAAYSQKDTITKERIQDIYTKHIGLVDHNEPNVFTLNLDRMNKWDNKAIRILFRKRLPSGIYEVFGVGYIPRPLNQILYPIIEEHVPQPIVLIEFKKILNKKFIIPIFKWEVPHALIKGPVRETNRFIGLLSE